jgi:hypothetical protein
MNDARQAVTDAEIDAAAHYLNNNVTGNLRHHSQEYVRMVAAEMLRAALTARAPVQAASNEDEITAQAHVIAIDPMVNGGGFADDVYLAYMKDKLVKLLISTASWSTPVQAADGEAEKAITKLESFDIIDRFLCIDRKFRDELIALIRRLVAERDEARTQLNDLRILGKLASRPPQAGEEGWQTVPKEPTQAMLDEVCSSDGVEPFTDKTMASVYRDMLSAAPLLSAAAQPAALRTYKTCPDCGKLGYSEDHAGGHCWECSDAEIERLRAQTALGWRDLSKEKPDNGDMVIATDGKARWMDIYSTAMPQMTWSGDNRHHVATQWHLVLNLPSALRGEHGRKER